MQVIHQVSTDQGIVLSEPYSIVKGPPSGHDSIVRTIFSTIYWCSRSLPHDGKEKEKQDEDNNNGLKPG